MLLRCKESFFDYRAENVKPSSPKYTSSAGLYSRRLMICIPLSSTLEEFGLLNIEIRCNVTEIKFCSLTSLESVWNVTLTCSGMEEKGHLKQPQDRTGKITAKIRLVGGIRRNEQKWMCVPTYYLEWHFDRPKVCRRYALTSRGTLNFRIGDSFLLMFDKLTSYNSVCVERTWNGNNAA